MGMIQRPTAKRSVSLRLVVQASILEKEVKENGQRPVISDVAGRYAEQR